MKYLCTYQSLRLIIIFCFLQMIPVIGFASNGCVPPPTSFATGRSLTDEQRAQIKDINSRCGLRSGVNNCGFVSERIFDYLETGNPAHLQIPILQRVRFGRDDGELRDSLRAKYTNKHVVYVNRDLSWQDVVNMMTKPSEYRPENHAIVAAEFKFRVGNPNFGLPGLEGHMFNIIREEVDGVDRISVLDGYSRSQFNRGLQLPPAEGAEEGLLETSPSTFLDQYKPNQFSLIYWTHKATEGATGGAIGGAIGGATGGQQEGQQSQRLLKAVKIRSTFRLI